MGVLGRIDHYFNFLSDKIDFHAYIILKTIFSDVEDDIFYFNSPNFCATAGAR